MLGFSLRNQINDFGGGAMFSSVIFTFLCTSVFSDILVLKAGDTLICDHYREVLDIEQRLYLCDGDTVYPEEIRSRMNEKDTFYYADNAFLKKNINGRLSFFDGIKEEIVWEDISNSFNDPVFQYVKKRNPVLYYSFDDINYYKYKSIGPNRLLADSLKENAKAFKYYRNHRITKLTGFISANAFVVPLLIGLLKYNDERAKPFIIMSASGMLASVCITVSIPKRLFNKAITCYNSQ
jgi:hypothetical protein